MLSFTRLQYVLVQRQSYAFIHELHCYYYFVLLFFFLKVLKPPIRLKIPTKNLSDNHAAILSIDSGPSVPLVGELNEGVALVDGAAHDLPILGEDGLHVRLGDQQRVQVADEDPRVQRALVRLVGDVAGHQAGGGG